MVLCCYAVMLFAFCFSTSSGWLFVAIYYITIRHIFLLMHVGSRDGFNVLIEESISSSFVQIYLARAVALSCVVFY